MPKQIPIVTHSILNNTEARSDHDECTNNEEHVHTLLPGNRQIIGLVHRVPLDPPLEDNCRGSEKAKYYNLDHQAGNDDTLAELRSLVRDHQASPAALHHKGEDVPGDKHPGQVPWLNQRVVVGADAADDAAQTHVYRCGEEGWAEQDKHILDSVGHDVARFVVC